MTGTPAPMPPGTPVVTGALALLAVLFAAWFIPGGEWVAAAVFATPPLALAARLAWRRGIGRARFWAAVLALGWFSHGVMVAWSRPGERGFALAEVALALVIVFAASMPALRARLGGGRRRHGGL